MTKDIATGLIVSAVLAAILSGLLPVLVTKLIVKLYRRDDARRAELRAELLAVPFVERLPWVFQTLALALTEGLPARWQVWRSREDRPFTTGMMRALDVFASLLLVILAAPVLVTIALLIKVEDRGPVLFKQRRVGRGGEAFEILKFRTMLAEARLAELMKDNERTGLLFKMERDPRVTRIGRFLRATSLDELPQVFNVLNGTMSFVGPRPALPSELDGYSLDRTPGLQVRPGITGLWQISGVEPAYHAYRQRDLEWVRNRSVLLYLKIIALTVAHVLVPFGCRKRERQN